MITIKKNNKRIQIIRTEWNFPPSGWFSDFILTVSTSLFTIFYIRYKIFLYNCSFVGEKNAPYVDGHSGGWCNTLVARFDRSPTSST